LPAKHIALNGELGLDGYVPRPPRYELSIPAVVVTFGRPAVDVTIRNVSQAGLCVETAELLPISSQVIIVTEVAGSFPAQVRWALGHYAGFYFNGQHLSEVAQFLVARSAD
jgi:hypothetical protein